MTKNLKLKIKNYNIPLVLTLLLAVSFRLWGLNWDQGQHLHPDERFLTMVTAAMKWPGSAAGFLDTAASTMNPHNIGFPFFVYGTFPLFLTKFLALSFRLDDYGNITLLGRGLSALFDTGTAVLVYLTGGQLFGFRGAVTLGKFESDINKRNGNHHQSRSSLALLAAFFYAVSVLSIQLSHYYAVDTFLTFFITAAFYFCIKLINQQNEPRRDESQKSKVKSQIYNLKVKNILLTSLLGVAFGLAIASKISAILFLPIVIITFVFVSFTVAYRSRQKVLRFALWFCVLTFAFCALAYLVVRVLNPYLFNSSNFVTFTPNSKVIDNWNTLKNMEKPSIGFPPGIQWLGINRPLYALKNNLLWGLGLPMGLFSLLGFGIAIKHFFNVKTITKFQIFLLWPLILIGYQMTQTPQALRYFHPVYPLLAILASYSFLCFISLFTKLKIFKLLVLIFSFSFLVFSLIWPLSFLSIYSRPHSRVMASEWIYQNIPAGSILTSEYWDDALPLNLNDKFQISNFKFQIVQLHLYDPDTPQKWQTAREQLSRADYIILSSNRLWSAIGRAPDLYPTTALFYRELLNNRLQFKKIAEISSHPSIPYLPYNPYLPYSPTPSLIDEVSSRSIRQFLTGLTFGVFVDDTAEESFTVYDHPKVLIFKKTVGT